MSMRADICYTDLISQFNYTWFVLNGPLEITIEHTLSLRKYIENKAIQCLETTCVVDNPCKIKILWISLEDQCGLNLEQFHAKVWPEQTGAEGSQ
jgi:hypothetical protein